MKKLLLLLLVVLIPLNGCASGSGGMPMWADLPSPNISEDVRRSLEDGQYEAIRIYTNDTVVVIQKPLIVENHLISAVGDPLQEVALKDIDQWQVLMEGEVNTESKLGIGTPTIGTILKYSWGVGLVTLVFLAVYGVAECFSGSNRCY
ncbi:MAG: hypothetical protein CMA87_04510 [Euryarchaeota archaeon]|nr:hypothetical protein [Euryarchaeota archaeon]